jgi:hypothetical protein
MDRGGRLAFEEGPVRQAALLVADVAVHDLRRVGGGDEAARRVLEGTTVVEVEALGRGAVTLGGDAGSGGFRAPERGRLAVGEGQCRRDNETESAAAKGVRVGERVGHRDVLLRVEGENALQAVPPAGKAGAAVLRHKILDAVEERLAAALAQHALRQQESAAALRRVESMLDHLALWLLVLLPAPRQREMDARQEAGRQAHGSWRVGARRLYEDGGPRIDRAERREAPR